MFIQIIIFRKQRYVVPCFYVVFALIVGYGTFKLSCVILQRAFKYIYKRFFYIIIQWMATRKGIIITCLAILVDTLYAFCIFYYYILSNISLT